MSVTISTHIFCDLCHNWNPDVGVSGVMEPRTAEARKIARKHGWIRKKVNGRYIDVCPDCKDKDTE